MIYSFERTRDFLQSEFDERVRKNPRYSLRGFAAFLGVNPAELSQVFRGKRNLSLTSAHKITKAFGFNSDEARYFLWLLQKDKGKSFGLDLEFLDRKEKTGLKEMHFTEISQWYHFAILNLLETKNFEWSARYVSKKLGLTLSEAGLAMRDLQKVGLVVVENKNARSQKKMVYTASSIPSEAIRGYHQQMLVKAKEALDSVALHQREFQSVGLALRQEDMPKLKAELDEFTDRLMAKYHKRDAADIYQIQVCVFPLTKGEES